MYHKLSSWHRHGLEYPDDTGFTNTFFFGKIQQCPHDTTRSSMLSLGDIYATEQEKGQLYAGT